MAEIAGLIASAVIAAASAAGSAVSKGKAERERTRIYNANRDYLNSEYYRDPLSTIGNRALLKSLDQRLRDSNDALENRAAAGGATFENQLAARKANNEAIGNVYNNILMSEDARRQAINQQKMQLDQNYSAGVQAGYMADSQNWQAWGAQASNAALSYGSTALLQKK